LTDPSDSAAETRKKSRPKTDPLIGRTVGGRYSIHSKIGVGGMGVVYKAKQGAVDRDIAIKVLIPSKLTNDGDDESVIRRFHLEARASSKLIHPNTITIYDFGQDEDGLLYIAMEFLDGIPLNMALRDGPMESSRVVAIMTQICSSLSEAHRKGIIHRDLKPDNIFLLEMNGQADFVKVLDFGVAKIRDTQGEKTLTQAGMIFGTPKYMSPEQARCMELDPRSDLYSLGVMMYQMLTGHVPFDADDQISILLQHCGDPPPPMDEAVCAVVPPELRAVVFRALEKDREDRYQSTDEMGAALTDIATTHEWARPSVIISAPPAARHNLTPLPSSIPTPSSPTQSTDAFTGGLAAEREPISLDEEDDWAEDLGIEIVVPEIDPVGPEASASRLPKVVIVVAGLALVLLLLVGGAVAAIIASSDTQKDASAPVVPEIPADVGTQPPEPAQAAAHLPDAATTPEATVSPALDTSAPPANPIDETAAPTPTKTDEDKPPDKPKALSDKKERGKKPGSERPAGNKPSVDALLDSMSPKSEAKSDPKPKDPPPKKEESKPRSGFEENPWD
jgi:serine/threonine-protein kinase